MRTDWKAAAICMCLASACATTGQGTKPGDMSATQHQSAADAEQAQAEQHQAQFSPSASDSVTNCPTGKICWSSTINPTKPHEEDAQRHRQLATAHRQASATLVAAEANACAGVPDEDRDMSPFRHREDIVSVAQLERKGQHGKTTQSHLAGATIVFRAVPGLTEQWLQRVLDCHQARNAALGYGDETMPYCPAAVKGATASVRAVRGGFAIDVRAEDPAAAQKILARAQALQSTI